MRYCIAPSVAALVPSAAGVAPEALAALIAVEKAADAGTAQAAK
jgi:hypothetical protein